MRNFFGIKPLYPPRTIIEVHRLNQDDIMEVEGTFTLRRRSDPQAAAANLNRD